MPTKSSHSATFPLLIGSAAAGLAPSSSIASGTCRSKLQRLEALKARIDRELVRATFDKIEDLTRLVERDINRVVVERLPLGYSHQDVWRR